MEGAAVLAAQIAKGKDFARPERLMASFDARVQRLCGTPVLAGCCVGRPAQHLTAFSPSTLPSTPSARRIVV
ncbi:MAG TPA: hypothetical protein VHW09_22145 [Bryobacteraceae bacterium]|nr:hypothetical protein [Bryobacteraceae bacterium]